MGSRVSQGTRGSRRRDGENLQPHHHLSSDAYVPPSDRRAVPTLSSRWMVLPGPGLPNLTLTSCDNEIVSSLAPAWLHPCGGMSESSAASQRTTFSRCLSSGGVSRAKSATAWPSLGPALLCCDLEMSDQYWQY